MNNIRYQAYGLQIESELPLPLPESDEQLGSATELVYVRKVDELPYGRQQDWKMSSLRFKASDQRIEVWLEGVGRYLVENGETICVKVLEGASMERVSETLLETPMAALLLQRLMVTLHASCVCTPNGAILMMGPSWSGKSSAAMWMTMFGYPAIADDFTVLRNGDCQKAMVLEGEGGLLLDKRMHNVIKEVARSAGYSFRKRNEKYRIGGIRGDRSLPRHVRAIYLLHPVNQNAVKLSALHGAQKVLALLSNTHSTHFVPSMNIVRDYVDVVTAVAERVEVTLVTFPRGMIEPRNLAKQIIFEQKLV